MAALLCGESNQVQPFVDELVKRYPKHTVINGIWLPAIRGALALQLGDALQAIESLQPSRYEAAAEFWPRYLRDQAWSRTHVAAVKEKRPIVIQRNLAAWIALYRI